MAGMLATARPLTAAQRGCLKQLLVKGKIHPDNRDTGEINVLRSLEARGLGRFDQPAGMSRRCFVLTDAGRAAANSL